MAAINFHPAYDSFLDFLVEKASPQEILAFKVSVAEQEHMIELLDKQDEGTLTSKEAAELETIQQMELLIIALQTKARAALRDHP